MNSYHTKEQLENFNNKNIQYSLAEYAANGDLEGIKNLISDNNIKNISFNESLSNACRNGHLNIVKFFLETENFKKNISLYAKIDFIPDGILLHPHFNEKNNIVDYLLYDIKCEVKESTKKFLRFHKYEDLLTKIEKRDLFFKMSEEINNSEQIEAGKNPKFKL